MTRGVSGVLDTATVAPRRSPEPAPGTGRRAGRLLVPAAVTGVVAAGVALRFVAAGPMWLDEAQSVAIARLPLDRMVDALRHDGAPALYYLLLHGWMALVGTGTGAVRALSGLLSVAALPLFYRAAAWMGRGRSAGLAGLVLAASNPWLIRYASEARMYSLLVLLVLLGGEALRALYRRPDLPHALPVALAGAALLHTHYWSFFLLAAVGALTGARAVLRRDRASMLTVAALVTGGLLFTPWLPWLLYQSRHTGTPWAVKPPFNSIVGAVVDWSTAGQPAATPLVLVVWPLVLLGAFATSGGGHGLSLDPRGTPRARVVAAVGVVTLGLAFAFCRLTNSAFVSRYTAVVVPMILILAAVTVAALPRAVAATVALVLAVGWLGVAGVLERTPRTQAGAVAAGINAAARSGDTVVYCPDQLGPGTSRLIRVPVQQVVYPTGGGPQRVDWVDYAERNGAASPDSFATRVASRVAPGSSVWLVSAPGYRTFGGACAAIGERFGAAFGDGTTVVKIRYGVWEHFSLQRWTRRAQG